MPLPHAQTFIAAIAGIAWAVGLRLHWAATSARPAPANTAWGWLKVNLGRRPGWGTQHLPRLIPKSKALHMMVTGEPVGPDEACWRWAWWIG